MTKVRNFPIMLFFIAFALFFNAQNMQAQSQSAIELEKEISKIHNFSDDEIEKFMDTYQKTDYFMITVEEGDTWYHLERLTGINWGMLAIYNERETTLLSVGDIIKVPSALFMQRLVYADEAIVMELKRKHKMAEESFEVVETDIVVAAASFFH